jgi:hypothetical protein
MIITTRDLALNGNRAFITFNTELDKDNGLTWSISLVDPLGNCSSTTGYITLDVYKPVATEPKPVATEPKPVATEANTVATEPKPVATEANPVVTEANTVVTEANTVVTEANPVVTEANPVVNQVKNTSMTDDDLNKQKQIKFLLNIVENSIGYNNKKKNCIILLNYISNTALQFVNKHKMFKEVVIEKCWEIKIDNWDDTNLCSACDNLLNGLKVSWIPSAYVDTHGRLKLLRKIFDEKNLILTRQLWNKYSDWSKTVNGLNRYKKMIQFIDINKENIQIKA